MAQVLEQTADPETVPAIEATLNYVQNTGEKLFTYTGGPGSLDVRTGGTVDPQRVTIRNGRSGAKGFTLDRNGFHFVPHPTKMKDFFDEDEIKRVYYPEMEALIEAESGAKRVVVFDHTLRTADDELREKTQDPRSRAPRAQRLHRMVGAAARARHPAGRGRRIAGRPVRDHPGLAADPPPGRDPSARHLRRAQRRARRTSSSPSAAIRIASARPTRSPTIRSTTGTGSRACGATRRWCSRCSIRRTTAAPAGPRTPRSTIRPRRPTPARARASRSGRSRFSRPAD